MFQGKTLGEKHKSFNALVQKALKNEESLNTYKYAEEKCSIDRLFKIELAVKSKDVGYIIQTLKSDDTLYVSRALKATWLITDEQYAHVINPEHLYTVLFPQMYNKAVCKLKLTIRLHLKSEERCQQFFNYLHHVVHDTQSAFKFLPSCSEKFLRQVLEEGHDWHKLMNAALGKRICERFPNFTETIMGKVASDTAAEILHISMAKTHTELYCSLVEKYVDHYCYTYNKHLSKIIVNQYPEIIMKSYLVHLKKIDLELVSKLWSAERIEQLIKLVCPDKIMQFNRDDLEKITKRMSPERREEILNEYRPKEKRPEKLHLYTSGRGKPKVNTCQLHLWYEDVPFDTAFTEIKHLVRAASNSDDRYTLLKELIQKTGDSEEYLYKLLLYYYTCHMNEVHYYKLRFLNSLHDEKRIYKMSDKCWKIVNDLYISVELYAEANYFIHNQNIVYYSILHNLPIPQNIMDKYLEKDPDTAKYLTNLLGKDGQTIWDNVCKQFELKCEILRKQSGIEKPLIDFTRHYIKFIKRWGKELADRPYVIKLIRDIVRVKPGSIDYPTGGRTRRLLFEDSILMSQDKEIILNILKHDSNLLIGLKQIIEKMITTKKMILYRRVLQKIATYFNNMAVDMTAILKEKLRECENKSTSVNNVIRGLALLAYKKEFLDCIQPYKPTNHKIDWSNDDIFLVNIRKGISQNLHHVKPSIDMDTIHEFAKGDYLQFSVPALLSTCTALPFHLFMDQLPKLLDSPVSTMRHGIRLAYVKLESDSLVPLLQKMWKECKNIKIRFVIFETAFKALGDEKDEEKIQKLWTLLKSFIASLHKEDDKNIFLGPFTRLDSLPVSVRCEACQVCYEAIKCTSVMVDSFSIRANIIKNIYDWLNDGIDVNFAAAVIVDNFTLDIYSIDDWTLWNYKKKLQELIVKHITSAINEEDLEDRYEKADNPVFSVIIENWNVCLDKNDDIWNFREILISLFRLFGKTSMERLCQSERNFISTKIMYNLMEKQFENICNIKSHFSLYLTIKFLYITEACIEEINLDESKEVKYKIFAKLFSERCVDLLMYLLNKNFGSLIWFGSCMKDFTYNYLLIRDYEDENTLFYITVMDTLVDLDRTIPENILGFYFTIDRMAWSTTDKTKSYLKSVVKRIRKINNSEIRFHFNKALNSASPALYKEMVDELQEELTESEIADEDDSESTDEDSITQESSGEENFADKTKLEISVKPNYSYCNIM